MRALLRYINEKKVAEMTGPSVATLPNDHCLGWGIPYTKVGQSAGYSLRAVLD
jgi:hypothetical protein